MKLLLDMNLSPRWREPLVLAGFEVTHWSEIGPASAPDVEIMEHARLHDCIILTHDLDFSAILAATQGHKPSVIQLRAPDIRPEALAEEVIAALKQLRSELEAGALITVTSTKRRLRILPLSRR